MNYFANILRLVHYLHESHHQRDSIRFASHNPQDRHLISRSDESNIKKREGKTENVEKLARVQRTFFTETDRLLLRRNMPSTKIDP